jgi:mannose-6-phosphate isomerase-like protein (cupin superfamily)
VRDWTKDIDRGAWIGDVDAKAAQNTTFRTVLYTRRHAQLTVMSIRPGEDIGREVHRGHDQFLRVVEGHTRVELGPNEAEVEQTQQIGAGWAVIVPVVSGTTW